MITASALLAESLRAIPDAASAPPPTSGEPTHANFRSVLEQAHSSRENAASTDDDHSASQQKHKDSDPTADITAAIAPPPVEAPRLILPFTNSLTLRQDTTAPSEDADAASADPNPQPSAGTAVTFLAPAVFSNTLDLRNLPLGSESNPLHIPTAGQPKTQDKGQAKLSKNVDSAQAAAAPPAPALPADPSAPLFPLATSSTLQQTSTTVETSSTASEAPDAASTPTFAATSNLNRRIAYQFHSSPERPVEAAPNRAAQPQPKASDPAAAITVPLPAMNAVVAPPPVHVSADSNPTRQSAAAAAQSSAPVVQDPSAAAPADSKTPLLPVIDWPEDTTAATSQGSLAFAARLTPTEDAPAPAPDANRTVDSQSRMQATVAATVTAKQAIQETNLSSGAHSGESGSQSPDQEKMSDRFAKLETLQPQTHAVTPDQPAAPAATNHTSASPLSPADRMDQAQEAPAPPASGSHDITIRIPDATTDQGTAVRFVERAGEVHVSVRTGDAEMAQTLRGGLNDLVNRLEDGGIRTQVWQPGADASTSQNNSQHPFADPDGSNGRQFSSGSNAEQESKQHNKPRWVEELEGSIGNPNFKETTQLLWQA